MRIFPGFAATSIVRSAVLAGCLGIGALSSAANSQTAQLPVFSACKPETAPTLPTRWRAVSLMMPFLEGQLDVGEFVYDATIPALRASIYGLESGAVDLLITNEDTYQLSGPYRSPDRCTSLGRKFNPPSAHWMPKEAVCVGEAPLATVPMQWWKAPGVDTQANWHWFKPATRLPWRSVFVSRSPDPAVVGDYAMSYFPTFTELPETNLSQLRDFCVSQAGQSASEAAAAARTARALMSIRNPSAEAERLERIATLIPGLSHQACSRMTTVRWPDQFVMTAMLTPISFREDPYSSLILYDWSETGNQFAVMFQGTPSTFQGLVALKKGFGYRLERLPSGTRCPAVYPGIVKPDWMTAAKCQCKGMIDRNAALSPDAVTQVFSCPIKQQAQRVMWSWYTTGNDPVVFMEAGARGGGVMLADYHQWRPGEKIQPKNFDLPNECVAPDTTDRSSHGVSGTLSNPSCSDCHTTPW